MIELLKKLAHLRLAPVSPDMDRATKILVEELPFTVHEFPSGREHNGWLVPQSWWVERAEILQDHELIIDGANHPMGVFGYSQPFSGRISLDELRSHLAHHPTRPDDLVYHCDLYYKVGRQDWGFTMPRNLAESLKPGDYEINLETRFENGVMKVLEYHLQGETDDTIIINAHNCHAGQANDDLSGVVVGVEVMKRLAKMPHRRYSYRLIIAPEHFGTVFYAASLDEQEIQAIKFGIFLEAVGNSNRLALQTSFDGDSMIDTAADLYLSQTESGYEKYEMRGLVGNDETVWEAPGLEIPTISLTRFPFDEYHSNSDTAESLSREMLESTVESVLAICDTLDRNVVMRRKFTGLIALSHPRFDLYIPDGKDPAQGGAGPGDSPKWNRLMDRLTREFDGDSTVLDVAVKHGLPFNAVREYVQRFEEKGLIETESV